MLITPKKNFFLGKRNKEYSNTSCLVQKMTRPLTGWSYAISIKGTRIANPASSPEDAVGSLTDLLSNNGIEFTAAQVWATLNYQWLSSVNERYQLVSLDSFSEQCVFPQADLTERGKVPPSVWIIPMLDYIGTYLACDELRAFSQEDISSVLSIAATLSDPSMSSATGDYRVHETISRYRREIWNKGIFSFDQARSWFISLHYSLSRSVQLDSLDFTKAKNKYEWK